MATKTSSVLLILVIILVLAIVAACWYIVWQKTAVHQGSGAASASTAHDTDAAAKAPAPPGKVLYHCPMHPNYISDKPGDCPICGMTLVPFSPVEAPAAATEVEGHTSIVLNPERRQMIGVQVGMVTRQAVARTIRAVGRVDYNENGLASVNLKFSGWIEELKVKAVGDPVRKDAPLFTIYSPDLLEAQRNYLLARQSVSALSEKTSADSRALAEQVTRSARDRLLLWDVSEAEIKQIETTGEPLMRVTVSAKADGVVTARNVVLGQYAEAGRNLFETADLSTVWLNADIYEYELPLIHVGQEARAQFSSLPGETVTGKVAYIYPYLNDMTRTARVRLELSNPEGKLKPGMYATVMLDADLGEQLVVDDSAILFTGKRDLVFVDKGAGVLEPREVTVGQRTEGMAVILAGLAEGDQVVTSGNFLVDSESRLKAALKAGAASVMAGHEGHGGAKPAGETTPSKAAPQSMPNMPGMPM